MNRQNQLPDDYKARIISKSMYRLRGWMQKEMHRPWPNTEKIWRVQQRCRRYEDDLNVLAKATRTGQSLTH